MFGISSIRFHGLWYSISSVSTKTVLGIPSPFLPFPQKRSWVIHLHILVHLFPGKSFFPFITIVVKFNMHPHFYTGWLFFVRLFKLFSVPGPSVPTKTQKRSWYSALLSQSDIAYCFNYLGISVSTNTKNGLGYSAMFWLLVHLFLCKSVFSIHQDTIHESLSLNLTYILIFMSGFWLVFYPGSVLRHVLELFSNFENLQKCSWVFSSSKSERHGRICNNLGIFILSSISQKLCWVGIHISI